MRLLSQQLDAIRLISHELAGADARVLVVAVAVPLDRLLSAAHVSLIEIELASD
jgi:hypothetical protein